MTDKPIARGRGHITLNAAERRAKVLELSRLKMPVADIAEQVGCSPEHVSAIRKQALRELNADKTEYAEVWRVALTELYSNQLEYAKALQGDVKELAEADEETKMMKGANVERGFNMVMSIGARLQKLWVPEVATTVKQEHSVSSNGPSLTASGLNSATTEELEQLQALLLKLGSNAPPQADVVDIEAVESPPAA